MKSLLQKMFSLILISSLELILLSWMLQVVAQGVSQFLTNKEKISTVNTCESTSNQPPTPTGQTHCNKYTTSKAYQNHGGRFETGKIFILTDEIISEKLQQVEHVNHLNDCQKEQLGRCQNAFSLSPLRGFPILLKHRVTDI